MTKKNLSRLFRNSLIGGGIVAVAFIILHSAFYGKAIDGEIVVRITSSTKYGEIVEQLRPSLRSALHRQAFDFYAKRLNLEKRYKAGYYIFNGNESVIRAVRRLVLGEQTPVRLVIGEARTLPQLAGKIAAQIETDSVALLSAMRNKQIRKELGFVKDSTIAMFIPNTYEVWWSISPEKLLHRIAREYKSFWNEERRAKLKRCRLTQYQVMTLASIVYEEVKIPSEMRMIAGVYINRLRRGIALQACPTVKYAMGDFALQRILHKHLKYRSPFNTYINRGLPPAPICVPSIAAIDAVLDYEEHKYLYFCARPELDGRHNFSRTLKEHNANAQKYAKAIERLKINR